MAGKTLAHYPPYEGTEPYLCLCFSDRDEKRIRPLLRLLRLRGCRTWYALGQPKTLAEREERNRRMLSARLMALYLTDAARRDVEVKGGGLVRQKAGQPILVLNTDGGDSGLSMGLTSAAAVMTGGEGARDVLHALLHGPGFSQELMGPPLPVYDRLWMRRIAWLLAIFSVLLGAGIGYHRYAAAPVKAGHLPAVTAEPTPADEVTIEDDTLRAAVRKALGGAPITVDNLGEIYTLSLEEMPEKVEELGLLSQLSTLELSEAAAKDAPAHPELYERYTLILKGGAEP